MRLTQLHHFLAVIDGGSIREAARRLGMSQPALTKSIKTLEAELKIELIKRGTRGIVPTAVGNAFAARARAVHAELRRAREEIDEMSGRAAGRVAFGVGQAVATLVLPAAVQRFRSMWPRAEIRVVEGLPDQLLPQVRDESLDFAIGAKLETLEPSIAFKPLLRSSRVVVARKGHPLTGARSLAELRNAEWIDVPPMQRSGVIERLFRGDGAGTPPLKLIRCESYQTAASLLARSDLVALMSRRQLAEPFAAKYLTTIPVRDPLPGFTVGLYVRAGTPMAPAADAMAKIFTALSRSLASAADG
jgi:DNA-binding transcriptional LysR family regulator